MKKLFLTYLFTVIAGFCFAQLPTYYLSPHKKLSQYNFKSWTTDNGLPSNSLLHILQSSDGYLWISGYSGLLRFDGNTFTVFNSSNTNVFESNVIRNLGEDKKGNLWMTTQGSGLVSYKNGTFTSYGKEMGMVNLYRALLIDNKDRVWSASPDYGWFYLENGKFHFVDFGTSLKNIEIRSIVQSYDGTIWFATLGKGFFKYDNGILSKVQLPAILNDEWIYSLFADDKSIWMGTSSGVYVYDGKTTTRVFPEINSTVNDILKDRYGNMWFGTINGLYKKNMSEGSLEYISTENGLTNNFVVDFLFDFEGNFWITQYKGGLTRISDGKFTNYTYMGGLPGKVVNTISEISPSSVLVGFDNGSLAKIENSAIRPFKTKTDLSHDRVRHIMIDSKKNTWISTYNGLLKITPTGQEFMMTEKNGFPCSKIRLSFEDSKGNIWIGTRNNGLVKIDKENRYTALNVSHGLSSNLIMSINEDKKGNLWIGSSEGTLGLDMITPSGEIRNIARESGFNSEIVFNIYCDSEGVVWVASVNGLWMINDTSFYCFNSKKGLIGDSPYDVVEDNYGYLWMPFSEGIMKVSKKELINFSKSKTNDITCVLYDSHDGMKQSECNPTAQVMKSSDGKLYFPTLDGIAMIDPLNMMYNNYIPPVYIENIRTDNQFVDLNLKHEFEPGFKRYTFYYTATCLYDAEKVKFRYRLKGFEDDWNETDNVRSVSYTNLRYGDYTFQVTASNNDQIWNEKGTEFSFRIKPRFIETIWFYTLVLILFFSVGFLYYWVRIKRLERQKKELEKIVSIRTHEILEKNHELEKQKDLVEHKSNILLQQKNEIEAQAKALESQKEELKELVASKDRIFSIISHDLRAPLGNIKNMIDILTENPDRFDVKKRNVIFQNFSSIIKSTFYLIDNLLNWTRSQRGLIIYDPQIFLVTPVIDDVLELFKPVLEKKKIEIFITIDDSTIAFGDINMVNTIFRNLISNAVKFTPDNGKIEISSSINDDKIVFSIKDNGIGMSEENLRNFLENKEMTTTYGTDNEKGSGLGLLLCRDFIAKNGGDFYVESQVGKGTTFFFTLKRFQV
jgi:ligand-binding sensor domain-containing protein/signal transduction histidine kinase